MQIEKYPTLIISENEFEFFSEGPTGRFALRIRYSLISPDADIYNLGFGLWIPETNRIDDKTELRNGDTNKILATVGQNALNFLNKNPLASITAAGSMIPAKLAIRTRKYQKGLNSNYDFLSEKHNIYGFIAEKTNGEFIGHWPRWQGSWEVFDRPTNYDAFLLNLK